METVNPLEIAAREAAIAQNNRLHLWDLVRNTGLFVAAVVSLPATQAQPPPASTTAIFIFVTKVYHDMAL
jgi:hypothetical protein